MWFIGQQRAGRARRQRFVPYVADDRYRSLNRTGPRAYGLAIERQLRRSRGLIEETRQRTQDRHINQESVMEFESDSLRNAIHTFPETRQRSPQIGRILYYAAYILHFGLSEVQVSYLEELMKVFCQHESPVSTKLESKENAANLSTPIRYKTSTRSFYESLGNNEEERRKDLLQMRQERAHWRSHLYQALQKALRDVQASKYKENNKSWIASNKRKTVAVPEEGIGRTSNKQKRKALVEAAEDNIEMIDETYLRL